RTFSAGGDGPPCTFLERLGETVLMASKSKRSSRGATSTVGDVKFETTGPTVELNGPTPTDKGDANGAGRGRTRPSRKTTRRASGKTRTNRSTPKEPPSTTRELDRQARELEKEATAVRKKLDA